MNTMKVKCNRCGQEHVIFDMTTPIECSNCHNNIDLNTSLIKNSPEKKASRIMFEIENMVIVDENCMDLVNVYNEENDLIRYLKQKDNKNLDLSWLTKSSFYYNLIIKDVMRSRFYNDDQRLTIVNSISDNELLLNMLNESVYKTEESKEMVKSLYNEKIEIVKNAPHIPNDLFGVKIIVGLLCILFVFLFGLFMDKDLARPTVILLSLLPSCILGITLANKLFKKSLVKRIIMCVVLTLVWFYIISYIESIRYSGWVGLFTHLKNMVNALPDFADELFRRLDIFEEIKEPEPVEEGK